MDTLKYIVWMIWILALSRGNNGCYGAYEESMLDRLTESCPYLSTCSRSANEKFPASSGYKPCCRQCSCDEECHRLNNCCPEVSKNSTVEAEHAAPFPEECISTAYPDQGGNGYSSSAMFLAVTSCSEDYSDSRIAQRCADTTPEHIQQVAFVSDAAGTVYRNIYCAQCHDVTNPRHWQVAAICNVATAGSVTFQLSLHTITQSGCALLSQPPNNEVIREKRCFKPDTTSCNVTGQWQAFDPVIERACSTETVPFFIRLGFVYSNVFCFFCNNIETIRHDIHTCQDLNVLPMKGIFGAQYMALLDTDMFERSEIPPQRDVAGGCKFNEIHDSNAGVCRELHCPPGEAISNGKCEKAFLQTNGFSMKLFFKIQPKETLLLNPTYDDIHKITNATVNHVIENMKKKKCGFCHFSARKVDQSDPGEYFLRLIIRTSPTCPFSVVLKSAESVDRTSISVDLASDKDTEKDNDKGDDNDTVVFVVDHLLINLDDFNWAAGKVEVPQPQVFKQTMCYPEGVPVVDFLCPYVEVSGLEYVAAIAGGQMRETHHYQTYDLGVFADSELANMTFGICAEDYLPRLSAVGVVVASYTTMLGALLVLSVYE